MDKSQKLKGWSDDKLISKALSFKYNSKTYWNIIHELSGRASESLYKKCAKLCHLELPRERSVGITILSQLHYYDSNKKFKRLYRKEIYNLFLKLLPVETDTEVIISLLYGVSHNNAHIKSGDIDILRPFADSGNRHIRRAAVSAFIGVDKVKAIKTLIKLSGDRSAEIRDWATFGIGTMSNFDNDAIRSALYRRCSDKDYSTRMEAIYGLAKRKDEGVKKHLEKELDNCTVYVLESIRDLGAKEFLPCLEAMFEQVKNDPDTSSYWLEHLTECIDTLKTTNE